MSTRCYLLVLLLSKITDSCHGSCNYAEPVAPSTGLPWWAYCCSGTRAGTAAGIGRKWKGRRPPGGGTRHGTDPVTGQRFKTCGNSGRTGWADSSIGPYAVCCSPYPANRIQHLEGSWPMGNCATLRSRTWHTFGNRTWRHARQIRVRSVATSGTRTMQLNARGLIDGSTNPRQWMNAPYAHVRSCNSQAYVQADLGTVHMLTKIMYWHYHGDSRKYCNNQVELSRDGSRWTIVFQCGHNSRLSASRRYNQCGHVGSSGRTIMTAGNTVNGMNARYVRWKSSRSNQNKAVHFAELKVFGLTLGTTSPTSSPSTHPSVAPSRNPSTSPSISPTAGPSVSPTTGPSDSPTPAPSKSPTDTPSHSPTKTPTKTPTTKEPTKTPTKTPTTESPSGKPTVSPTKTPSRSPSLSPSAPQSRNPSSHPTSTPTMHPTASPTKPDAFSQISAIHVIYILVAFMVLAFVCCCFCCCFYMCFWKDSDRYEKVDPNSEIELREAGSVTSRGRNVVSASSPEKRPVAYRQAETERHGGENAFHRITIGADERQDVQDELDNDASTTSSGDEIERARLIYYQRQPPQPASWVTHKQEQGNTTPRNTTQA